MNLLAADINEVELLHLRAPDRRLTDHVRSMDDDRDVGRRRLHLVRFAGAVHVGVTILYQGLDLEITCSEELPREALREFWFELRQPARRLPLLPLD